MEASTPQFVPTTLQRLRCFLDAQGGLKVRPWAPVEDVLDALHDALRSRRRDETFWPALAGLLEALVLDQRRRGAEAGRPSPFETIDIARRDALLGELRRALAARRRGPGRFRRLARALSAPAAAVLLLLAGTATLGCYGSHSEEGDARDDAAADAAADADTRRDDAPIPDVGRDDADVRDDAVAPDDATPDDVADADSDALCDAGGRTLEELVDSCVTDEWTRTEAFACIATLNDAWRAGLASLAACTPCDELGWWAQSCLTSCGSGCNPATTGADFDLEAFLANCGCYLYIAVRFE